MKNIRIGNDINVAWSLYRDDAPFPLEGENISLHLQTPYGRIDLEDFSVEGNVISWIFRGKNQKVLGKYSLILFINKGEDGMVATDACDFVNLVDCSCKVGIDDGCGVETEYVNLTSKVDVGGGSSYDDTELRNEIARVDADLTELSTEVSGLSERIDNLPTAESSVFEAVYGKTTYAEIVTAYEENRMIYLNKDNMQYVLQYILPNTIYFVSTYQKYHYQVGCVEAGSWFSQRIDLNNRIEDVDNGNIKVTIDSKTREVATPQYVENLLGTIINGDY